MHNPPVMSSSSLLTVLHRGATGHQPLSIPETVTHIVDLSTAKTTCDEQQQPAQ
jgi:hypothetical protein